MFFGGGMVWSAVGLTINFYPRDSMYESGVCKAGLTIWWALRTPQRRGPTGKLNAEEGENG